MPAHGRAAPASTQREVPPLVLELVEPERVVAPVVPVEPIGVLPVPLLAAVPPAVVLPLPLAPLPAPADGSPPGLPGA